MVSVCKTVTDPSRKIITKCTDIKMTCLQSHFFTTDMETWEKYREKSKKHETLRTAHQKSSKQVKVETLPQGRLGGGPWELPTPKPQPPRA